MCTWCGQHCKYLAASETPDPHQFINLDKTHIALYWIISRASARSFWNWKEVGRRWNIKFKFGSVFKALWREFQINNVSDLYPTPPPPWFSDSHPSPYGNSIWLLLFSLMIKMYLFIHCRMYRWKNYAKTLPNPEWHLFVFWLISYLSHLWIKNWPCFCAMSKPSASFWSIRQNW